MHRRTPARFPSRPRCASHRGRPGRALVLVLATMLSAGAAASLLFSTAASAAPPVMGYQGRLTDAAGAPLAGPVDLTFRVFDVAAGGAPLWSESQPGVAVQEGVFHVVLGSGTPLPSALFATDSRWLEIDVNGETLAPRQLLLSVPYALQAERTARAPNLDELRGQACNRDSVYRGVLDVTVHEPTGEIGLVCRPTGSFELTVRKVGDGQGTVESTPPGIACGDDCSESFTALSEVSLTAVAAPTSRLVSIRDVTDGGDGPYGGRVDRDTTVEVRFVEPPIVTVETAGPPRAEPCGKPCLTYTGFVTLSGSGRICGSFGTRATNAKCQIPYEFVPAPTIATATPQPDAVLVGWDGCDAVEGGACHFVVDQSRSIRARFGPKQP